MIFACSVIKILLGFLHVVVQKINYAMLEILITIHKGEKTKDAFFARSVFLLTCSKSKNMPKVLILCHPVKKIGEWTTIDAISDFLRTQ